MFENAVQLERKKRTEIIKVKANHHMQQSCMHARTRPPDHSVVEIIKRESEKVKAPMSLGVYVRKPQTTDN